MTPMTTSPKDARSASARSGRHFAAYAAAGAAVAGAGTLAHAGQNDFQGPYDHSNWTFTTGSDAFTVTGTTFLELHGANADVADDATYLIAAAASGTVSFDWSYFSTDVGNWDYGGFYHNGVFTTLANNATQGSGSFSAPVNVGDTFGFFVTTLDGQFGRGELTITNFFAPIPAPPALALLAAGAVGMLRRGRARSN